MSRNFDWRDTEFNDISSLKKRYRELTPAPIGLTAWEWLIDRVARDGNPDGQEGSAAEGPIGEFLDRLYGDESVIAALMLDRPSTSPRLFISHRQTDIKIAERVACVAQEHGYDYWLDVHDPTLAAINSRRHGVPPHIQAVIVAAIIEIALLNCSHVIALLSKKAAGSLWIPYEYGRAKRLPALWNPTAASWVARGVTPPEYSYLATILKRETCLRAWLQ